MLAVEQVSFKYEATSPLLDDISFELKPGSILGILGHNGSGKTTLLRLISRLISPQHGHILWNNVDIHQYPRSTYFKQLGALIESPRFYDHLSLRDNLSILCNYRDKQEKLLAFIDRLGLSSSLADKTGKFSTGMRQRAALASILYFDPMLILLDEPTTGLDPDGIILTRTLFNEAKARGAAIIVTGHHLSEIDKVVDEFIILKNGKMLFHGPIESARKYRDLEEFYLAINKE